MTAATLVRFPFPLPKTFLVAVLPAVLLLGASLARAQDPWVDTGFLETTPPSDVDLVVVRETAFESVDLSAYDLGVEDYVQSIYFRLHAGPDNHVASFTGTVTFPEGVRILGFVTEISKIGREQDDGVISGADALLGIDVDPNDYAAYARGFETGGGRGTSEFILSDTERSFAFGLNVTRGVDDFRVLIDYGHSFPPDLSFDIDGYETGVLGGAEPSLGIQVGHPQGTVVGSGDFGEIGSLLRIPLTSDREPEVPRATTGP